MAWHLVRKQVLSGFLSHFQGTRRPVRLLGCDRLQSMNPDVISTVSVGVAIIGTLIVLFR